MDERTFEDGPASPRASACAIAPVRGDVTTARAAAALRRRAVDSAGQAGPVAPPPDAFPRRLLDVGPA